MNDPWDWAKQKDYQQQTPPPINNTLAIPDSGQTQAPAPIHGPPGLGQMAQTILVARGVNRGIDETYDAGKGYFNKAPHDPSKVPVEDRVGKAPATETSAPLSSNSVTPLEAQNAQENAAREANAAGRNIAADGSSGAAPTTATTAPAVAPTSTAAETGAVAGTTTALASSAPTTISEAAMLAEQYGPFLAAQGTTSVPYRTVGNTGKGGK